MAQPGKQPPQRPVRTSIDADKCVGCGLCVKVCPTRAIEMLDGKAVVTGERSLYCGHCVAACPTGAVTVEPLAGGEITFHTFQPGEKWLKPGKADPGELARLMLSRRSCRNYLDKPVSRELLEDLVSAGLASASGTNSQRWSFTILPTRQSVLDMAEPIGEFFRALNAKAEKAWLRKGLKLLGQSELETYYQEHHQSVSEALAEWEATGQERLFHGASAAILVGSRPGASTPCEDALLASGQMLLMAHALGLGTCLVGFAVEVLKRLPKLRDRLGLEPGEKIHSVIAVGWPDETYSRPAPRLPLKPRYWQGE